MAMPWMRNFASCSTELWKRNLRIQGKSHNCAMAVRINPAKILLWRTPTTMQIGLSQPTVIDDVTIEQERLLKLLERGIADDAIEAEDRTLIDRLSPVLLGQKTITKPKLSGDFVRGAFAEIIRASYATNLDGLAILENRNSQTIYLDSLSQGGLLIALGLAAAGIGKILTDDYEEVTEQDVGPLAYEQKSQGSSRIEALAMMLSSRPGSATIHSLQALTPAKRRHSLRVLTGHNAIQPSKYRSATSPHIAVFFGEEWVSVTPKLTGTPCLACLDHHKTEADPYWPALASQLVGRRGYLEDARSALFAASMVVGEILRAIDSPDQEREFIGHRLQVATGRVEPWSWTKHPVCECR